MNLGNVQRKQDVILHPDYNFWLPGVQAVTSGPVVDRSGNNYDAQIISPLTDAELWANPGAFTTKAAASSTGHVEQPVGAGAVDLRANSFMLGFWINGAAPTSQGSYIGSTTSTGARGIRLIFATNGNIRFFVDDGDGTNTGTASSTQFINSSWNHAFFAFDAPTMTCYTYKNGSLSQTDDMSAINGSTLDATYGWGWGAAAAGTATPDSNTQFRDCHCLITSDGTTSSPSGLPGNIQDIVNRLISSPFNPIKKDFY